MNVSQLLRSLWQRIPCRDFRRRVAGKGSVGVWSVVANVRRDHAIGPQGTARRKGTRQFRAGTKVYINGYFAGMCESVVAIGLHRKSRRWIVCVVTVKHLENFRVKMVYEPRVLDLVRQDPRCTIRSKHDAETWAAAFMEWQRSA